MTGSVRIIIDAPPELSSEVLVALLDQRRYLDRCAPGFGWGYSRSGQKWSAFFRKTKSGYSAKVQEPAQ